MRKLIIFVLAIAAMTSCNQPDKTLIAQTQEELLTIQSGYAPFAVTGKSLVALQEQLKNTPVPADSPTDTGPNSAALDKLRLLIEKQRSISEQYNDMQIKLQSIIADYSAGKIDKEAFMNEHKLISESIKGLNASHELVKTNLENLTAQSQQAAPAK